MNHNTIPPILARLASLAEALREPRPLSELATILEVTQRTVLRDIAFLRSIGATVEVTLRPYVWRLKGRWNFWTALQRATKGE